MRRFALGLATITGWARRGYFIPYRYASDLPQPGDLAAYDAIERLFQAASPTLRSVLDEINRYSSLLHAIGQEPAPQPRWAQDWFPRLDAAAAYALVRRHQPRVIVEIGSGHSTRFMARAMRDGGVDGRIIAIDPAPRATITGLDRVEFIRRPLHQIDGTVFAEMRAGDILFIDSSHILMPGSDVDQLLNRILPTLPAGVFVHIHDIFLPDDYPKAWSWRGYNEQQGVAMLLQGGAYEIVFASRYVATRLSDRLKMGVLAELPLLDGAYESSLWLKKIT